MASCSRERPRLTRGERSVIEALQGREVLTLEEMKDVSRALEDARAPAKRLALAHRWRSR